MKALFNYTSKKPFFYFVVIFFTLTSIYMGYYILHIFNIYPKVLDLEILGYSTQKVTDIFDAYGKKGMEAYKKLQIGDIIYPLSVFLFSGSILFRLYKGKGFWIYFIPLICMLSDYCENFFLWSFRETYPNIKGNAVGISNICSIIKHSSIVFMFLLGGKKLISKSS